VAETLDRDPGPETVSLGRFDPLELPIILDALRERGIFALTKSPLEKGSHEQYHIFGNTSREVLLVDRTRADEARRIIAGDVRAKIKEMQANLGSEGDVDFEAQGLVPLGWVEPEVARELLTQLRAAGVPAEPEYPLDSPPPPYARADGRVRVHVDESSVEIALDTLSNDVRAALAERGITPSEPMLGEDE
jgi:hypothetical protein